MKRWGIVFGCMLVLSGVVAATVAAGEKFLKMSTTTSTQASGLLDVLLPELEKDTGIRVNVIAKGTGAAIRDGMDGNVDIIFVHAKSREEQFVAQGYGTQRFPVMHNDFVIIGPSNDPAKIMGIRHAAEALKKIATAPAFFVSRGDDSGTHTKEQQMWAATGLPLQNHTRAISKKGKRVEVHYQHPQGLDQWYLSIGQGMGKTLTFAEEKQAYTMADRGTLIKYKYGRKQGLDLEIVCEGDPLLVNPYAVIPVNPAKHPHVKADLAQRFVDWLTSARGQAVIRNYRLLDRQLFFPDVIP